jgi:hypothetical protein
VVSPLASTPAHLTDVNEWINNECAWCIFIHHTFITSPLIHIRLTEKIALEIAVKVVSVNRPLTFEHLQVSRSSVYVVTGQVIQTLIHVTRHNSQ